VELLISISIIALMSALSIAAYPKFSAQLSVASESYRLLGFLRETQAFGVSSYSKPGEKTIYGILVDKDTNTIKRVVALQNQTVNTLQANSKFKNSDFINSATDFVPGGDQDVAAAFENPKFKIAAICSSEDCNPDTSTVDKGYALYKRPNPEARIVLKSGNIQEPSAIGDGDTSSLPRMVIFLEHPTRKEMRKKVVLLRTGQMYVEEW
jgi:hypothetical protein